MSLAHLGPGLPGQSSTLCTDPYHQGTSLYGAWALAGHMEPQEVLISGPGQ